MKHFSPKKYFVFIFLFLAEFQLAARADQIIYDDALQNNWADWSYSETNNFNYNGTYVHSGTKSISATITSAWGALSLEHSAMDSSIYTNLTFWINGGPVGGQRLQIYAELSNGTKPAINLPTLTANTWQQLTFSLATLGVAGQPNFNRFSIQDRSGAAQPAFYVDDISLMTNAFVAGTNAPVSISINALANRIPISPLIYGVAFASSSNELQDLNTPLHRSGGNAETRYNWQLNATSHAADWYFESIADSSSTAGADGDSFILESKNGGAQAMLTIPIIGWVTKLGANRASRASYSIAKYGAQTDHDPYWADAGNGIGTNSTTQTSWLIITNNPTDANMTADTNFQAGWVQHLTNTWGNATNGGLQYYIMDNEWSLWNSTHRDVHPIGATMDEVFTDFCNYATMVKGIDPNALVAGPEEWGWPGYFYSGYDQQTGNTTDRAAHGGQDFAPWFLNQVQQRSQTAGRRLLDIFTLHCYPQENNVSGNAVDYATELLRNQSTRVFWDTNYVDPSWINNIIALIPRMKNWVATNYPGTKIGVTEYNWGAEPSMNGATAQADILGIFGREGLDLATRWTTPDPSTPTYLAIKMYRNYDGNKSTFGDTSILAVAPNPDDLAAFAAMRTSDGAMTIMVINKDLLNATTVALNVTNFSATGIAQCWQLASNNISRLADFIFTNNVVSNIVPAQSITLFILPNKNNFGLQIGTNHAPGQIQFVLNGEAGQSYTLQSSADLVHWTPISTNTFSSNSFPFSISTTDNTMQFYRSLWLHQTP